ncbi:MAG: hypothetical protein ACYCVB_03540 [Bacilli bacterium]
MVAMGGSLRGIAAEARKVEGRDGRDSTHRASVNIKFREEQKVQILDVRIDNDNAAEIVALINANPFQGVEIELRSLGVFERYLTISGVVTKYNGKSVVPAGSAAGATAAAK